MPGVVAGRVSIALCALILIAASLKYAENLFAPIFLAFVLGVILSPISDFWERIGAPAAAAAFATLLIGVAFVLTLGFLLEPSISRAIDRAPVIWFELRQMTSEITAMLRGIDEISANVAEAIDAEPGDAEGDPAVALPTAAEAAAYVPHYLAQVMILIGTLYFFLLVRRDVYEFAGKAIPRLGEGVLFDAEKQVARYFLTIAIINGSFGVIVATTMALLGMPAPILWGMLAFLLNFIMYLGPAVLAASLLVTGIVVFDGAYSFLPAALYLTMNATEAQFVTPGLIGKSMSLNPLLVFLSLVFWLWLWGPLGGFIAIPLLIWSMIIWSKLTTEEVAEPQERAELQSAAG